MTLAEYLSERKMTQEEFARLIGTTQTNISRYATGRRLPQKDLLIKIREATGWLVTADDFFQAEATDA